MEVGVGNLLGLPVEVQALIYRSLFDRTRLGWRSIASMRLTCRSVLSIVDDPTMMGADRSSVEGGPRSGLWKRLKKRWSRIGMNVMCRSPERYHEVNITLSKMGCIGTVYLMCQRSLGINPKFHELYLVVEGRDEDGNPTMTRGEMTGYTRTIRDLRIRDGDHLLLSSTHGSEIPDGRFVRQWCPRGHGKRLCDISIRGRKRGLEDLDEGQKKSTERGPRVLKRPRPSHG